MKVTPRTEVARAWREYEAKRRSPKQDKADPELANLRPALYLTGPLRLPFRGRMWCAHVAFDDGVRAVDIGQRMKRAQDAGDVEEFSRAVKDARFLASRLLRRYPERWWHWLGRVTGLRRSPVRDWTQQEAWEIVGFFLIARTSSRVGGWTGTATGETQTSSTSWPSSSAPSRRGAKAASR